ncbi:uncharacterized protein FTOL_05312 [Fusarium torulosum]|uniref:Uncharacterized protein n=1 Tax=Fusarium torulosum TaxID=33205 RepID=A0AAE8M736_9HYPO|nr:uncharacterized protein FTOL_05312 [Fusarium torulosum]
MSLQESPVGASSPSPYFNQPTRDEKKIATSNLPRPPTRPQDAEHKQQPYPPKPAYEATRLREAHTA